MTFCWRSNFAPLAPFAAATFAAASPAAAQEYCVACTEPVAIYRCVIDGVRPGAVQSLPMLCQNAMTQHGSHGTCAIRGDITVLDCNGPIKRVAIPLPASPSTNGAAPVSAAPADAAAQPSPAGSQAQGDPKTVVEMLRRAKQQSDRDWAKTGDQIKSNNDKVGGFFKKSWDCLSTLFSRCDQP